MSELSPAPMSGKYPRKNAKTTRGRPFTAGNPGRPKGSKNMVTRAVETLLEGEAEALTRKAIDLALGGDVTALRLCMERISPPRKGRELSLEMPQLSTPIDIASALGVVVHAVSIGKIDIHEAAALAGVLELQRRALETVELEVRLKALEEHWSEK
jgi:hypothetical protein